MIVSNSKKFIFIHIHKTGGESITETLKPYILPDEVILDTNREAGALGKHSTALNVRDNLPAEVWDTYFKFAVVRHPIDRVISLYGYCAKMARLRKRTLPQKIRNPHLLLMLEDYKRWPAMKAFASTTSFSEFIRHPELVNAFAMRLQTQAICDDNNQIIVDRLARFEHFDDEIAAIQSRLGVPRDKPAKKNISGGNHVERSQLLPEDITFLAHWFEADFALLGYAP